MRRGQVTMQIKSTIIEAFQKKVFSFYKEKGRKGLPWRKTTDRYAIFVSEIMLQQTQVERVIPKYDAWLKEFPTVKHLAKAPLAQVLTLWSGLGYNSRAKRLHDAAKIIVEQYNSIMPNTPEELIKLPGIGPYTAKSILIFADNQDLATVDTNIRRILIKELSLPEKITDNELFTIAQEVLPYGKSRDWHNALMDYGSLELTSKRSGIKPKTTQSKFAGSKRWYRGALIKHLTKEKSITLKQTKELFANCPYNLKDILEELVSEELVRKQGKKYIL